LTPGELARIDGPVGLPIGARAPSEIAIAILAELVQLRRQVRPQRVAGIVLAAGTSSRMGRNKLVESVGGTALARRAVDAALASRLDPILVVTGHEADRIGAAMQGAPVTLVQNDDYREGLSSSLRSGIGAVPPDCDGAMILLGDMPGISPGLIDRLVAAFEARQGRAICVACARKQRGHPVLWPQAYFKEMSALGGDKGARELLEKHAGQVIEVQADDDAPLTDIDTVEALARYCRDAAKVTPAD
jgi:molybdenum cofactor cytidylyltransferase